MSATITLTPPSVAAQDWCVTIVVARIVRWRVEWDRGDAITEVVLVDSPPARIPGNHHKTLLDALDATVSKVDEDVELIARLRAEVEDLKRRVISLERLHEIP